MFFFLEREMFCSLPRVLCVNCAAVCMRNNTICCLYARALLFFIACFRCPGHVFQIFLYLLSIACTRRALHQELTREASLFIAESLFLVFCTCFSSEKINSWEFHLSGFFFLACVVILFLASYTNPHQIRGCLLPASRGLEKRE